MLKEDLDGGPDDEKYDPFRELADAYDHPTVGWLYEAYLEVAHLGALEKLQIGRQSVLEMEGIGLDGALAKLRGGKFSFTAFGGIPGNIYEDPGFVDPDNGNFALTAGSPLQGSGIGLENINLAAPANLVGEALEGGARLTFASVDGATGYVLYWGESAGSYTQSRDLGKALVGTVDGLAAVPYYFAVATKNGGRSKAIIVTPLATAAAPVSEQTKPEVFGINPTLITTGSGALLTVTGKNFSTGAKVLFGSDEAGEITVVDANTITVKASALKPGIYPAIVVNTDLGRGALTQALTVRSKATSTSSGGCASTGQGDLGLALAFLPLALLWLRRRDVR